MKLAVTIDITNKCNLKCRFCYYFKNFPRKELSDEEWLEKIKWIKKILKPIHCSWLGGEPLLRYELLKKLTPKFLTNWVFTNGTLPLNHLKRTSYGVSVYGPKRIHDFLRSKSYDKIRENISSSRVKKIFLINVINSYNYKYLEEFVKDWVNTNVKGVGFYFMNNVNERIKKFSYKKVWELKKEYPGFIFFYKEFLRTRRRKECIIPKISVSFSADGKIKKPCFFGFPCSECLCILPTIFEDLKKLDLLAFYHLLKTFSMV